MISKQCCGVLQTNGMYHYKENEITREGVKIDTVTAILFPSRRNSYV